MGLCSGIQVAQRGSGFNPNFSGYRIDIDSFHILERNHQAPFTHRVPRDVMTGPADREKHSVLTGEGHGADYIPLAPTVHY